MCGIAGIYLKAAAPDVLRERIEPFVDMLYKGIEHRGKHATGLVAVSRTGEIRIDKEAITASKFIKDRESLPVDPWYVLLHTRYKTKGSEKDFRNNHPVIWKTCFTTHNGSISNDDWLFKRHQLERHAEVDSEILPALMYQSKFDIEKMQEYLDQTTGPMAMATINPTEFPGKLVLAKTHSSPLFYFNSRQLLIWASEVEAMREAWAKVFGTPPDKQKFVEVKNRTLLVVENDKITKHNIPYARNYTPGNYVGHGGRDLAHSEAFGVRSGWVPSKDDKPKEIEQPKTEPAKTNYLVTDEEIKQAVEKLRFNGDGAAVCISEMRTLPYYEQQGPWRACEICTVMVKSDDITATIRGSICCDCKTVWEAKTQEKRGNGPKKVEDCTDDMCITQPDFAQEYDQINAVVRDIDVRMINFWGQDEEFLHTQTISQMANGLLLEAEVIDYILFRSDPDMIRENEMLSDILPLLSEIYETIREQLSEWLDYDDEEEIYARFVPETKKAEVVEAKVELPFRFPDTTLNESSRQPHKCRSCRSKTTAIVGRDGHNLTYCSRHFDTCSHKKCKAKANHTLQNGDRVCHTHARNQKGWADSALRQEGYVVGVEE